MPVSSKTKRLTVGALCLALSVVFSLFSVPILNILEIRFNTIVLAVAGSLLGPGYGAIIGGLSDVLGYLIKPTGPFFPGFTVSSILSGVIFGLFLHKNADFKHIVLACVINGVCINFLLNSLWLSMLYGNAFIAVLATRVVSQAILLPINIAILTIILKPCRAFLQLRQCGRPAPKNN